MPIKLEILADTPDELMLQLKGLIAGSAPFTTPAMFREYQEKINQAVPPSALPPETVSAPAKKAPPAKKAKASTNGGGVKPLPEDDDPLAPAPDQAEPPPDEAEALFKAGQATPKQLIDEAVSKLRDLFRLPKAQPEVRKLKEKYGVTNFNLVPLDKATDFWNDITKLEQEVTA